MVRSYVRPLYAAVTAGHDDFRDVGVSDHFCALRGALRQADCPMSGFRPVRVDLGYEVIAARDAADALERLRSEKRIDVLFSDIVMPGGMNGVQLAVEARRMGTGLHVVLASGYTNEAFSGDQRVPVDIPVLTEPHCREELTRLLRAAGESK